MESVRPESFSNAQELIYGRPAILFPPTMVDPDPYKFRDQLINEYRCLSGSFNQDCCNQKCGIPSNKSEHPNPFLLGISGMKPGNPENDPMYFGPPLVMPYRTYTAIPVVDKKTLDNRCLPCRTA
jgi:hypothetical protein